MDIVQRITGVIEPSLESMGYRLVLVKLADGVRRKALTIMAERIDEVFMSFDDCEAISQTVSALLDVDDPITSAYDLEVCSPGIDRPLTKPEDFVRYQGYEIKCETLLPVDGRKRFRGILKASDGKTALLVMEKDEKELVIGNIRTAKLVMTDALVADTFKKSKS